MSDGPSVLDAVFELRPDLILLDIRLRHLNGFEVCRRLKASSPTRLIPVVLVTNEDDQVARVDGLDCGADDFISKPLDQWELRARARSLLRTKCYIDDLDSAESLIVSLALTIEARDPTTRRHCERLAQFATKLGHALCLPSRDIDALRKGAYLHDVGKVGIPDAVLLKAAPLTVAERELMKQHTVIGERLCGALRSLSAVRPIVRHHHELLDGSGYPDGLHGVSVPYLAQIVGLADAFEALISDRPYRRALSVTAALTQLELEGIATKRDLLLVNTLASLARSGALRDELAVCDDC